MLNNKYIKYLFYIVFIGLLIHLSVTLQWNEVIISIQQVNFNVFISLLILQCLTQFILLVQWTRLTHCLAQIKSYYKMFYILCSGSVIEALTPGAKIGGEFTRYHYLKKELAISSNHSSNIIIVQKCISMSVLFTICIVSMLYLFLTMSHLFSISIQIISILLSLSILICLIIVLFFHSKLLHKLKPNTKVYHYIQSYHDSITLISNKEWLIQYGLSLFVWIVFPIKMVILVYSLNLDCNIITLFTITMVAYAMGTLPITPGGIGTFETTLLSLFQMISIELSLSFIITIVFRFITFWFVFMMSFMFVGFYKFNQRRNSNEKACT